MANSIKYIRDKKGNKTGVVVPIRLWEKLKTRRQKNTRGKLSRSSLAKYSGTIRLTIDPLQYQKTVRHEWR